MSSYIAGHEEAEEMCEHQFPIPKDIKRFIMSESTDNRKRAEEYIKHNLNVSFPEISQQVQTKKAAYTILGKSKEIIDIKYRQGQLETKHYHQIRSIIEEKVYQIENL
jgi:hypothetical protein